MSDLFWLSGAQFERIEPYFPLSHGVPRVDDHRVVSGIVFVIKNGLRWRDAPKEYGPHKTLYSRFIRWSRMGVFDRSLTTRRSIKSGTKSKTVLPGSKTGDGSQHGMTAAPTPSSQASASPPASFSICVNES